MKISKGKYTINCSLCSRVMGYSASKTKGAVVWCFDCDRMVDR